MTNFPEFTLAAIQAAPNFFNRESSTEKACELITKAADKGATLAAFGETWLPGYPWWVWRNTWPQLENARVAYLDSGVEIPSATTDRLCQVAGDVGIDVVIGVSERDTKTLGTVYCTLLFVGREGRILGSHRKLKPTIVERTVWGEGDGSSLRTYERQYGRISGLNCWEHMMMLPAYSLVAQGTQIHVAAWPFSVQRGRGYHLLLSQALAVQGCCYVIAVGAVFKKEAVPTDFIELETAGWEQEEGGSCIIAPDGALLAEAESGKEMIITATGSLETVLQHKSARDIGGHYSRPDVLQLQINRHRLERLVGFESIESSMASSSNNITPSDVEGLNKQET